MIAAKRLLRWIGLGMVLVLGWPSLAWPQPAPSRPGTDPNTVVRPSKALLDYAEVAKADIAAAQAYLQAVATEISTLRTQILAYRDPMTPLQEAYDREYAETRELTVQREADGVRHWVGGYPPWSSSNTTAIPSDRTARSLDFPIDGTLSFLRSTSAKLDRAVATINSMPATAAKMNRAYRESEFVTVIDNAERDIAYATHYSIERLWNLHLSKATWDYHLLSMTFDSKIWKVQKPYAGELNAIEDEWLAAVEVLSNTGCKAPTVGDGHVCQDRWFAVDSERLRRNLGVCESSNKQIAPYIVELASLLQALALRLKETHERVVGDFRRIVTRLEQNKGGAKVDIFAEADRYLKSSQVLATSGTFVNFDEKYESISLRIPFSYFSANSPHKCVPWSEQTPAELAKRFPAVTIEFDTPYVRFYLALNQRDIVQGEADARGDRARP